MNNTKFEELKNKNYIIYKDEQCEIKFNFICIKDEIYTKDKIIVYVGDNLCYNVIEIDLFPTYTVLEEICIEGRRHIIPVFQQPNSLDKIMSIAHHILLYLNINNVELQDVSEFKFNLNIKIGGRELRTLLGKKSIYEKYGYKKLLKNNILSKSFSNTTEIEFSQFYIKDIIKQYTISNELLIYIMKFDNLNVKQFTEYLIENKLYNTIKLFIDFIFNIFALDQPDLKTIFLTNNYYNNNIIVYNNSTIKFI